ncbi:hypothetical protein KY290_001057 [Solanum tuberosum]|uniref:Putative plant transposon protein domain-containing protein n=1 Tax=Solanum tuberosum TaxID=4113 RepID=A0ABQ7WL74_SOLTU|nr:hypothetical protein KY290_001057 [Solanum tuberosum]
MNKKQGNFARHLTKEIYSSYASLLINLAYTESSKKWKKTTTSKLGRQVQEIVRGERVDISENTINRFLHGLNYTAPTTLGQYKGCHNFVTSEIEMEDLVSKESIMNWIAGLIATDNKAAAWVANSMVHITKASLTFLEKVKWEVVRAQLQPIGNDQTLSPSQVSLVACIISVYAFNVRYIIATEMRDFSLNEKVVSFSIRRLCVHVNIPPNKLVDIYVEAKKINVVTKIKDVRTHYMV